jgi:HSP20 family protein
MKLKDLIPFRKHSKNVPARRETHRDPFVDMERFFDGLLPSFFQARAPVGFGEFGDWLGQPKVEVEDNGKEIVVTAELPGVEDKDLEVRLDEQVLLIRGEKRREQADENASRSHRERWYGSFERRIPLPAAVDGGKAKASSRNGVLTVRLPRIHEETSRQIPVNAA